MTKRILVTGKNGQLGNSLQKVLNNLFYSSKKFSDYDNFKLNDHSFIFVSRDNLNLSNSESIKYFLENNQFKGIINCAAYTSVDKAESNLMIAEQINHYAVSQLAKFAKISSIPLIQISTDYVFQGRSSKPYDEADETNPQNIYGLTKLKGEKAIIESGCTGAIIRTSWLHSEFGNNFVKTMLNLSKGKKSLNVVNDQIGSPTYATNLAKLLLTIFSGYRSTQILNTKLNIYHFSDDGICSWFDFAKAIFDLSNISCQVNPLATKDYKSIAKRPLYNVMNKRKIRDYLPELEIQHWRDALRNCLIEINKKSLLS